MEKRVAVTTVLVKLECNVCSGEMVRKGHVLASWPPQYNHECKMCGHSEYHKVAYPYIDHEEIK